MTPIYTEIENIIIRNRIKNFRIRSFYHQFFLEQGFKELTPWSFILTLNDNHIMIKFKADISLDFVTLTSLVEYISEDRKDNEKEISFYYDVDRVQATNELHKFMTDIINNAFSF